MKKIVRILGVTLTLLVLASCSSNDDDSDNVLPPVNTSSLSGSWRVSVAVVDTAVDTNGDGISNQDLIKEGYNSCEFDNTIEISETTFSVMKKGASCGADEKNEIYEYKFDEKLKTLDLYVNGKVTETLKKVYLQNDNGSKELIYDRFDKVLNQMVYFKLSKI